MTSSLSDATLSNLPESIARIAASAELRDPMDAPALRWGILGAGLIARRFTEEVTAHTRSTVAAIGARDVKRAQAFAAELDIPRAYGSYDELIDDPEVDALYIATINPTHHDLALRAIESGKPILVEKPFTLNAVEASAVFAAAEAKGVFIMEAMWTRFLPQFEVLRAITRGGQLGKLVNAHANFAGTMLEEIPRLVEPAQGGGALLDIGVYSVSAIHDVIGKPEQVVAAGNLMKQHAVDASAAIIMRTSEALGTARSNLDGRAPSGAEFIFEHGIVDFPTDFYAPGVLRLYEFDDDGPTEASADGVADATVTEWDATVPGGFQFQVAEVARCVAAGMQESEVMPYRATIEVLEIMDEARAAIGVKFPGE
ncbi:Gfo/Idh/MocA family protein [Gulosibacter chungangensis]|uniref:Gfo/Idh/MocA family oxidoreductase n=1 Tax=Gulosibacter chungangensis TaxID=979746 RepID=A0A7J5BGQ0_9MICO|nr:Gfo/Idh/MocA family oxidoreductase [Gulosibacter chungangensis]KAB1645092.1 Gfo/Idh/MocA family oxidoreductase [Gulosibacter chungangensis]